jgi:predicted nucleic-acid-binding Zn-ribbon protein
VYRSQGKGLDTGVRADVGSLMLNIRHKKKIFDDFKLLYFESYVCSQCGYLELYVEDLEELVKVETADNWEKVAPS